MGQLLPLFPLKLVVFPGEKLNLHIFEPRYRQLINECEEEGSTFGVPPFIDNKVMDYGTELRLEKIEKRYDNGELDIRTEGIGIFKIKEFYVKMEGKLYAAADIEKLEIDKKGDIMFTTKILDKLDELFSILKIKQELPEKTPDFSTFEIAHHVGFSLDQEFEFLTLPTELERQEFISAHLENLIPVVKEMEELRKKVQMNGHFKNLEPPEIGEW